MVRFIKLAVLLLTLTSASNARGQDADVTQLKQHIELLQAKLEAANLKIEKLQEENKQLKAGGAKPGAPLLKKDSVWEGTYVREEIPQGGNKVEKFNSDAKFTIKKRDGDKYEGELWVGNNKYGLQVEGTVNKDGWVTMSFLRDLAVDKFRNDIIGTGVGKGWLRDKQLDMKITIQRVTFAAELKVKLKD
ncbi:hypothetical protein [Zavarzinella formosa]|uniref:hypothetical protein n=1 Tax=Zavarzinella formosa TaxID=360055 RepID=UPI000305F276|nr:hypothetical protein [Zavarzinella formosa]